ncbi:Acylphosphatase [Cupriavidus pampae]|uniref:acylphosphatase n=2 Tax=Cupriavidus pampae TaxID=659251 RepID=A0ABM8Y235_9BURK|nr:Acylphosphatase [Cupriavidus pampae]
MLPIIPTRADIPMTQEIWHLTAHGVVQGVGYRAACLDRATALGLTGWVRNRTDGTVEVMAAGPIDRLEALRQWMQEGPPAARVSRVDAMAGEGSFDRFDWRPTA